MAFAPAIGGALRLQRTAIPLGDIGNKSIPDVFPCPPDCWSYRNAAGKVDAPIRAAAVVSVEANSCLPTASSGVSPLRVMVKLDPLILDRAAGKRDGGTHVEGSRRQHAVDRPDQFRPVGHLASRRRGELLRPDLGGDGALLSRRQRLHPARPGELCRPGRPREHPVRAADRRHARHLADAGHRLTDRPCRLFRRPRPRQRPVQLHQHGRARPRMARYPAGAELRRGSAVDLAHRLLGWLVLQAEGRRARLRLHPLQ